MTQKDTQKNEAKIRYGSRKEKAVTRKKVDMYKDQHS
jgi:hypothetical protein